MPRTMPRVDERERRLPGVAPPDGDGGLAVSRMMARVFTRDALTGLGCFGRCGWLDECLARAGWLEALTGDESCADVFERLYSHLLENYRCEYVFKNALAAALLARRRRARSRLLAELEVGTGARRARADLALFDHTSTVFEVKTELDSFRRLDRQLDAYRGSFDRIYVVTSESQAAKLEQCVAAEVGIMVLTARHALRRVRPSASHVGRVSAAGLFGCLRREEYCRIIELEFGRVPRAGNCHIWEECRRLFLRLDGPTAHKRWVAELRARRGGQHYEEYVAALPPSLKLLGLTQPLSGVMRRKILSALGSRYRPAAGESRRAPATGAQGDDWSEDDSLPF